jgi:mannose-1-phosphate guanylyltransferase/mannose-6-phosphate isomerase
MEHFQEAVVVPFSGQWSDVGSWRSVAEFVPPDEFGNRVLGAGYTINSRDTFVFAQGRPVVALGTSRLMIIDTPDALLVADESQAESVKDVVAQLESAGVAQVATHRRVARPWGWYDSIEAGERFQVKRICVRPGASLSLQFHRHRAEHWVVVSGVAEVTCGDQTFTLLENQSTYIPVGQRHRLKNVGDSDLDLIEIQSGSYLGEDDIVRLEDVYGRDRGVIQT